MSIWMHGLAHFQLQVTKDPTQEKQVYWPIKLKYGEIPNQASGKVWSGLLLCFSNFVAAHFCLPPGWLAYVPRVLQWNLIMFSIILHSFKIWETSWNLPFVLIMWGLRFLDIPHSNRSLMGRVNSIIIIFFSSWHVTPFI